MEEFLGSWKLESNEGLNELLVRLGAGYITRTTMNASKPLLIFSREKGPRDQDEGEVFSIKTQSKLKTSSCNFRIGYAFDETTMDGRTVRTVFTMDGNTLKQEQSGTKTTYITYLIEGNMLKMVIKCEDLTCFRNFKRVLPPQSPSGSTISARSSVTSPQSGTPIKPGSPLFIKENNGESVIATDNEISNSVGNVK